LVGRDALVSHVTELAADFEATYITIIELVRHIRTPGFVEPADTAEVFKALLYLLTCGLSLMFCRFCESQAIHPQADVEGTHPHPLVRLELVIPQYYEFMSLEGMQETCGHDMDRRELVMLCQKAALSASLYWTKTQPTAWELHDLLPKGLLTNPAVVQYLQRVIAAWDEMLPTIKSVRRSSDKFGLMTFTPVLRERVSHLILWGDGPEGAAQHVKTE
jgi:hypothetical protein